MGSGEAAKGSRSALFIGQTTARDHAVAAILQRRGYIVTVVEDVRHGFEVGRGRKFDLVVLGCLITATPALPDLISSVRAALESPLICVGPHVTPEQIDETVSDVLVPPQPQRQRRRAFRRR